MIGALIKFKLKLFFTQQMVQKQLFWKPSESGNKINQEIY